MQIEVKLSLEDAEGFQRAIGTLAHHHLKDECYYDFFFDFPYGALQERSSVLRLRVACDPSSVHARAPAAALGSSGASTATANGGTGDYDPEAEYEAFLRACRGESAPPTATTTADVHSTGSAAAAAAAAHGLPYPCFIPGAAGKLVLKQKNTVEHGHQMSFVAEDAQVPPAVVEALVRLAPDSLFSTGTAAAAGTSADAGACGDDAFAVLAAYADERPQSDDGTGESAIARIVAQLRGIASVYTPAAASGAVGGGGGGVGGGLASSAAGSQVPESSDAHFTQVRFAAMGMHSVYTQQQLATSQPTGGNGLGAAEPQLQVVAGFMTLRRVFAYAPLVALQQDSTHGLNLSEGELEFREGLRVRLDASYLLPGLTIYELEVPKCGIAVDDIANEVSRFLRKLSVSFHMGSESKFARYAQYLAATREAEQDASDVKLRLTNVNGYEEVRRNLQQLIHPTANAAAAAAAQQEHRHFSNTEVNPIDGEGVGDDETWWNTNPSGYLQETNEDFFFDSPEQTLRRGQTFLRLRKQLHSNKYGLVLKAHQVFSGGQQNSLSSKVGVSEVVARALIDNPTQFLRDYAEHFALVKVVWEEFGVRELCRTATFTTERLTVPWWASQSQASTMLRSWSAGGAASSATLAPQSGPIYTSASYFLSQQQQQQGSGAVASKQPLVPPLLLHLDRTLYKLPAAAQAPRVPFSQCRTWGERTYETYEIEVTNITSPTESKDVVAELTLVLNGLGVEWQVGVRSKLEQYFSLLDM